MSLFLTLLWLAPASRSLPSKSFPTSPPLLSVHLSSFHLSVPQWNWWSRKSYAKEETKFQIPAGLISGVLLGCSPNLSQPHSHTCIRKVTTSSHSGVRSGEMTPILGQGSSRLLSFLLCAESACPSLICPFSLDIESSFPPFTYLQMKLCVPPSPLPTPTRLELV